MTERHVSDESCANCHIRIDPFGFALESFDAIGRFRLKELVDQSVDTQLVSVMEPSSRASRGFANTCSANAATTS